MARPLSPGGVLAADPGPHVHRHHLRYVKLAGVDVKLDQSRTSLAKRPDIIGKQPYGLAVVIVQHPETSVLCDTARGPVPVPVHTKIVGFGAFPKATPCARSPQRRFRKTEDLIYLSGWKRQQRPSR